MNPEKIKETTIKIAGKVWDYMKLARLELIILAALLILDLVTKAIVAGVMEEGQVQVLIPNFLQFHFVYNELAAFGSAFGLEKILGPTAIRVIFIVITFIAVGIFAYIMYRGRGKNKLMRVSLAMIISGALGNLYDRLFIGKVRDFVEIVFFGCDIPLLGGESFAIFNIADAALVVGVILFLVYFIFMYKDPKSEDDETPDVELYETDGAAEISDGQTSTDNATVGEPSAGASPDARTLTDARADSDTKATVAETSAAAHQPTQMPPTSDTPSDAVAESERLNEQSEETP